MNLFIVTYRKRYALWNWFWKAKILYGDVNNVCFHNSLISMFSVRNNIFPSIPFFFFCFGKTLSSICIHTLHEFLKVWIINISHNTIGKLLQCFIINISSPTLLLNDLDKSQNVVVPFPLFSALRRITNFSKHLGLPALALYLKRFCECYCVLYQYLQLLNIS